MESGKNSVMLPVRPCIIYPRNISYKRRIRNKPRAENIALMMICRFGGLGVSVQCGANNVLLYVIQHQQLSQLTLIRHNYQVII